MTTVRQYRHRDVIVQVRGLEDRGKVKIHVEHKSGAALIVPGCDPRQGASGPELETRGFDGTAFRMIFDEPGNTLRIFASAPSPILGGARELELPRAEDAVATPGSALRVTGDEPTMPIAIKRG